MPRLIREHEAEYHGRRRNVSEAEAFVRVARLDVLTLYRWKGEACLSVLL